MMYHELQRLSRLGFSLSKIAAYLGINWRTAQKYARMSEQDFEQFLIGKDTRGRLLDPYEKFIADKLTAFPDTSAAQLFDWLKEHHPQLPPVNPKTVYNFVMGLRRKHNLPVTTDNTRQYAPVDELPYGHQGQADFGQYNMRTSSAKVQKVWFFVIVLSRSRMKFCHFQCRPFTTADVCTAHEKAFAFYGGVPHSIVYDQDSTLVHDENYGELLLTSVFRQYTQSRSFQLHFCRKADPESKGKVENAVGYIKKNFLYNRIFIDTDTLNQQALGWLERTANQLPHHVTRIPPYRAFEQEKTHLLPFTPIVLQSAAPKAYTVRKTNEINYQGNFYSLPWGTYKHADSKVWVKPKDGILEIYCPQDKLLCTHQLSAQKGKKIINNHHLRDTSAGIEELMHCLAQFFTEPAAALQYFEALRKERPRYIRDQLLVVKKVLEQSAATPQLADRALAMCLKNQCFAATDFESVLLVMAGTGRKEAAQLPVYIKPMASAGRSKAGEMPAKSDIEDYEQLINKPEKPIPESSQ